MSLDTLRSAYATAEGEYTAAQESFATILKLDNRVHALKTLFFQTRAKQKEAAAALQLAKSSVTQTEASLYAKDFEDLDYRASILNENFAKLITNVKQELIDEFLKEVLSTVPDKMDLSELMDHFKLFAERLDFAYDLYSAALAKQSQLEDIPEDLTALIIFLENFLSKILNVKDAKNAPKEISEKMIARMKMSDHNRDFIPGITPLAKVKIPATDVESKDSSDSKPQRSQQIKRKWQSFTSTVLLHKEGRAMAVNRRSREKDIEYKTKFFTAEARDVNRVFISDGVFNVNKGKSIVPFSTESMSSHSKKGFGAYVINLNGEISVFEHLNMSDQVAHSSINAQRAVLAAGEVRIDKNGVITDITSHSGHYAPSVDHIFRALEIFKEQGVDISKIKIHIHPDPTLKLKSPYDAEQLYNTLSSLTPHEKITRIRTKLDILQKSIQSSWKSSPLAAQFTQIITLQRKEIELLEKQLSQVGVGKPIPKKLERQIFYMQQAVYQLDQDRHEINIIMDKMAKIVTKVQADYKLHQSPIFKVIQDVIIKECRLFRTEIAGNKFSDVLSSVQLSEQLVEKHEHFFENFRKVCSETYSKLFAEEFTQLQSELAQLVQYKDQIFKGFDEGEKKERMGQLTELLEEVEQLNQSYNPNEAISDDTINTILAIRERMEDRFPEVGELDRIRQEAEQINQENIQDSPRL